MNIYFLLNFRTSDGSDETTENCIATTCPRYAFRCFYGGCVAGNAECNRKIECIGMSVIFFFCRENI